MSTQASMAVQLRYLEYAIGIHEHLHPGQVETDKVVRTAQKLLQLVEESKGPVPEPLRTSH